MSDWQMNLEELDGALRELDEEILDVELMLSTILRAEQNLHESEGRFNMFIENSSDGIWSATFGAGVKVDLPAAEQARRMLASSHIDYCNPSMARMYGFSDYASMIRFEKNSLMPPDDARNLAYLEKFVSSSYRLKGELSFERDRFGNELAITNAVVGRIENGCLTRAWGVQRVVDSTVANRCIYDAALKHAATSRLMKVLSDPRMPPDLKQDLQNVADAWGEID